MSLSTKQRLPRGEAKLIVYKWCDDYVVANGTRPTYSQAQQGTGVAAMTFSRPWAQWTAEYDASRPAAQIPSGNSLAPINVPPVILDAWQSAVATLEGAKLKELDDEKLLVRRELEKIRADYAALATEMAAILVDGESVQEEFEQERTQAAAALAAASDIIVERDATLAEMEATVIRMEKEMAVQNAELGLAKAATDRLEDALNQAQAEERSAHTKSQKFLEELTEVQIAKTRLSEELAAAHTTRSTAETALAAKDAKIETLEGKLESIRQELAERAADLSGANATVAGLREQLSAAENRKAPVETDQH